MGQPLRSLGLAASVREGLLQQQRQVDPSLANSIRPILRNANLILNTPEYFYCLIPRAYLSATCLQENGPLPLGVLIQLWTQKKWLDVCLRCNKQVYIIGATENSSLEIACWWGICPSCTGDMWVQRKAIVETGIQEVALVDDSLYTRILQGSSLVNVEQDFIQNLCESVWSLLKTYDNRPIIRPPRDRLDITVTCYSSRSNYAKIIKPVIPVPFESLFEILQQ